MPGGDEHHSEAQLLDDRNARGKQPELRQSDGEAVPGHGAPVLRRRYELGDQRARAATARPAG
ncbi:MAG: hypothetical protein JWR58_1445 [Pseudonocardia sp.]|jgi:hypothetical protein|nr:hypothetical protein [Pseudonocardia sp.]